MKKVSFLLLIMVFLVSCGGGGSSSGGTTTTTVPPITTTTPPATTTTPPATTPPVTTPPVTTTPAANTQIVSFDMSNSAGWVVCQNTTSSSQSTIQGTRYQHCYWYCGDGYKGTTRKWVQLDFTNYGSAWVMTFEFISSGVCPSN